MNVAQETLGLRRQGFSPCLSLLMSAFALLIPPADLSVRLRRLTERSPTMHAFPLVHSTQGCRLPSDRDRTRQTFNEGKRAFHPYLDGATPRLHGNKLKWNACIRSFGVQFEPRYIFRAGRLDQ
jgi:hypothetical protein